MIKRISPTESRELAVAESICALMKLPAVATNDWATHAAGAIACLRPGQGRACIMLVENEDPGTEGESLRTESIGVCVGDQNEPGSRESEGELTMRVRLERVSGFGFARTLQMMSTGFVGRIEDLNSGWRDTDIGRVWAGTPVHEVLIGVCPIEDAGGSMVVCMFGDDERGSALSERAFGSVMAVLARRTALMYRTMGCTGGALRWLTAREQDVLDALVDGLSVREIADRLGRSRHTMHDHVKNLHKKLNASCRGELVAAALGHSERGKRCSLRMPLIIGEASAPIQELKPSTPVRVDERSQ